jgi:hypothetical protein
MIAALALLSILSSVDIPAPRKVDSSLVRQILSSSLDGVSVPATTDWTLVGPVGDSAVLLADGTEWRRVPWNSLVATLVAPEGPKASGWVNLAPTIGHFLAWGAPVTGGAVSAELGNGHGRSSSSLLNWSVAAQYRHAPSRWIALLGGISYDQTLFAPRLRAITGDSLRPVGMGLQLGVCGPFACFEVQRHPLPLLEQTWLQPHLDSLTEFRQPGDFWTVSQDSGFTAAWEQRVVLHLGVLEYRASWCPELWKGSFQSVGAWDMHAGFLRFGTGLEWTPHRAGVRAALAVAPLVWTLRTPGSSGIKLFLEPLSVSIGFRGLSDFQANVRSTIRFADPFSSPTSPPL